MAYHTTPVVKLTLTLTVTGHNLAKTGTSPLNGPIIGQNRAYQAIFCTLKNYFQFYISTSSCVIRPGNQQKMIADPVGLVSKAISAHLLYRHSEAIYTFLGQ